MARGILFFLFTFDSPEDKGTLIRSREKVDSFICTTKKGRD